MFTKLNDFLQVQLVLMTCWKYFGSKCWRCSGLLRALKAGTALRGWGSDTGTDCTVRSLLPRGLGLCAPAACWQYLRLGRSLLGQLSVSALCPEGCAPPSCTSPGLCVSHWNTCALPCSLQQGLL